MARLPRVARLAALPVVAAVALAIVLPGSSRRPPRAPRRRPSPALRRAPHGTAATTASREPHGGRLGDAPAGSGAALYAANCSGCHGDHGQGLIGPSQQAAAFPSLVSGMVVRGGISMPAFRQFSSAQVAAVSNFVATQIADPAARTATIAEGGHLFRLYCSGCHSSTGRGGALSQGRNAPSLADYPAAEALAAMILGRGNMPNFAGDDLRRAPAGLYGALCPDCCRPRPRRAAGGWATSDRSPKASPALPRWACSSCSPCGSPGARAAQTGGARHGRRLRAGRRRGDHRERCRRRAGRRRAASRRHPPDARRPAPALVAPGWPAAIGLLVAIAGAVGFITSSSRATARRSSAAPWRSRSWAWASPLPTGAAT